MELDNIAQQVMESLKVVNPKHPMFLSSREQFLLWKYNNIIENQWNNDEGRQILNILIKILVGGLNCDVVAHSWKLLRKYLFMNYDLEEKISIPLTIVFHSVARRLGIRCDLIIISLTDVANCWLLKWEPKWLNFISINHIFSKFLFFFQCYIYIFLLHYCSNIPNSNGKQCFYINLLLNKAVPNINDPFEISQAVTWIISIHKYHERNFSKVMIRVVYQIY
ncbi:hypothetical protein X777_02327 [Ooceraea biroi]|uniref:Uncharacterized protein n=1 Tax=Ooceraea biroi TaxID=2015173 RepID=A0A026WLA3_OOCBI|nr:hypothetical protein X777_02327 [Ooceraea biroi]